jgi:hypothetical protein
MLRGWASWEDGYALVLQGKRKAENTPASYKARCGGDTRGCQEVGGSALVVSSPSPPIALAIRGCGSSRHPSASHLEKAAAIAGGLLLRLHHGRSSDAPGSFFMVTL